GHDAMRKADQALMLPTARPACAPGRAGARNPVRSENSKIVLPNDLCSPSRVLLVPGPGGAYGSGGRIRVSAGNDVTAADVAFALVRRVIKLACAVSESRVRARSAALRSALASS